MLEEQYLQKRQMLKALVLNPPYKVDGFTTSPKVRLKADIYTICKSTFNIMLSLSIFMTITCFFVFSFYLPLQNQNTRLLNTAKSITNKKLSLLVNLQEVSNFSKLFSNTDSFSLVDPKEVIYVNSNPQYSRQSKSHVVINRYPSIQFAGF